MLNINKQFVKYRPIIAIKKGTASLWWKYAFTSVCESRWRSYRFDRMKNHLLEYLFKFKNAGFKFFCCLVESLTSIFRDTRKS